MNNFRVSIGPVEVRLSAFEDAAIQALVALGFDQWQQHSHPPPWLPLGLSIYPLREAPTNAIGFEESASGSFVWNSDFSSLDAYCSPEPRPLLAALMQVILVGAWRTSGLLIHGAALARDNKAILALAPSGGGKSTLSDLAKSFSCLTDEAPLVLLPAEGPPVVFSTPFRSSASRKAVRTSAFLSHLAFLEKGAPSISALRHDRALRLLLAQVYRPPAALVSSADFLRRATELLSRTKPVSLRFPKSQEADQLLLALS